MANYSTSKPGKMEGKRPFTIDEGRAIASNFEGRYALRDCAWFWFGILTGLRITEICSTTVGHFGGEKLKIERRFMKGKLASRTVPLHAVAGQVVGLWIEELQRVVGPLPDTAYIFRPFFRSTCSPANVPPIKSGTANRILLQTCELAGVPAKLVGTHSMRKTYVARQLVEFGGDVMKVQRAIGHADIRTTIRYLSFDQSEIDEGILSAPT